MRVLHRVSAGYKPEYGGAVSAQIGSVEASQVKQLAYGAASNSHLQCRRATGYRRGHHSSGSRCGSGPRPVPDP